MTTAIATRQIKNGAVGAPQVNPSVITADGAHPYTGSQSLGGFKILDLAVPVSVADAVNKAYADALDTGGGGGSVSDEPYNPITWNAVVDVAPSKNAIRDIWVTLGSAAFTNSSAYDAAGAANAVQGNLNAHTTAINNPHSVTKAQVGLGNVDNTSDLNKPVSTAQQAAINSAVVGLWEYKGALNCSANPNYPAALKGDTYNVSVAGKIGGAAGIVVDPGDVVLAMSDNAGGTQAAVGASWTILDANIPGITTVGTNLVTTIPDAASIRFIQINANNTVTVMDAAAFRAAIGVASGGGTGDVVGPASTIDGAIAIYTGTTGKQIISDANIRSPSAGTMIGTIFRANEFHLRLPAGVEGSNTVKVALTGALTALRTLDLNVLDGNRTLTIPGNASVMGTNTGDQTLASLGATTVGANLVTLPNPNAVRYIQINGDNSITVLNAAAFRGAIGASGTRVVRETPTGLVNSANTAYTLGATPVAGSEEVFLNGLLLDPGAGNDYTIAGAAITMLIVPATGDKLRASYVLP